MSATVTEFSDPRLQKLDGFRIEIDPARERADIVLDRPPLNVIEMGQRDQPASCSRRSTRIRASGSSWCARRASIFPPAAISPAFWRPRPSTSRRSRGISPRRRAAPSRWSSPTKAIVSASGSSSLACDSASPPRAASLRCRNSGWARSRFRRLGTAAKDGRHQPRQGHRDASRRLPASQAYDGRRTEGVPDDELGRDRRWSMSCAVFAARPAHRQELLNETEDTNLEAAIDMEGH